MKATVLCKFCRSNKTIKSGYRNTKSGSKQVYQCRNCGKKFTNSKLPGFYYNQQAVIAAPTLYYLGYSLSDTRKRISARYKINPTLTTVSNWISEFGRYAALKKYRDEIKRHAKPNQIIKQTLLKHKQQYLFQVHDYKLHRLNDEYTSLKEYLLGILKKEIVIDHNKFLSRASEFKLNTPFTYPKPHSYKTYESKISATALKAARDNYQRHGVIQKFFLAIDNSTIAAEVPVFLNNSESKRIIGKSGGLLGHIDLLQVRNGHITVLDYKPDAAKEKRVLDQLLLYAIALSVRTEIHLNKMDCGWFDDKNYFKIPAIELYRAFKEKGSAFPNSKKGALQKPTTRRAVPFASLHPPNLTFSQ